MYWQKFTNKEECTASILGVRSSTFLCNTHNYILEESDLHITNSVYTANENDMPLNPRNPQTWQLWQQCKRDGYISIIIKIP